MHPMEAMRLSFPAEDWASCVAYLPENLDKVREKKSPVMIQGGPLLVINGVITPNK